MRDILVTMIVFGSVPFVFKRPYVGVLMLAWLGYMNPHRLSWGFAREFPFVLIMAMVTMAAMLFAKEKVRIPFKLETVLLVVFILWMGVTTAMALEPATAPDHYWKVVKIQIITFMTLMLITDKYRINLLIWVIVLSIGIFGFKGGIFTITTGGVYHVMGPDGTFIGGSNEIGLAMLMTIPLMRYLQLQYSNKWIKMGLTLLMTLNILSVFGTQSRGALLGIVVVGIFLIWKSKRRFSFLIMLALAVPLVLTFMPQSWWDRMESIQHYQQDESALGRINAWKFAINLAEDRPIVGGGYDVFIKRWFRVYAPERENVHDSHSIYFEVLAEHGYPGLVLFVGLLLATWLSGSRIIRACKGNDELRWAENLARMLQVSISGYMISGAFLGLAYFDYIYHIVAIMIMLKVLVFEKEKQRSPEAPMVRNRQMARIGLMRPEV